MPALLSILLILASLATLPPVLIDDDTLSSRGTLGSRTTDMPALTEGGDEEAEPWEVDIPPLLLEDMPGR